MNKYKFEAYNINRKLVAGEVLAEDLQEASKKIRQLKVIPINIKSVDNLKKKEKELSNFKIKSKELQIFTRQFSVLIKSGVPIVTAVRSIGKGSKTISMKKVLSDIVERLEEGSSLHEAMACHPKAFDFIYTSLVKAGESSGILDKTLDRLATHIEKSNRLKKKIKGALMYPVGVFVFAMLITFCLLAFVFPKFTSMYIKSGQSLPWLTDQVKTLSDLCINYWYVIFGALLAVFFLVKFIYGTVEGRKNIDKIMIDFPLLGSFLEKACIARFARSFSTLFEAGIRISAVLETCADIAGNWVYRKILLDIEKLVVRGASLEEAFGSQKRFPIMVVQMIAVGEQSGALDTMFGKIADFYEDEVENAAETFGSLLEPIMLVGIGGIVAVLVLAMYLPIFGLAQNL